MADKLNKIVEGTITKISQQSIDDNNLYQFEDYPVGGITNEQMTNALTSSQSGFYQTNSVYMCIDGGEGKTYLKNHFYRFNITSWEDVTPQFAGKIEEKTLQELESTTIEDSTLYAIDDYPLGGITQAQMTNALKITQRGFYKVNSVYLCVDGDGTSTYIKNHFYRFSYNETTDTYSWVDTKAGADVDSVLSLESENPVQNKVITENLNNKVSKTGDENIYGIKSFDVRPKLGIGDILPNEYQEVEYVETTGTQQIDTGIKPSSSNYFGIDMTLMYNNSNNNYLYSAGSSPWFSFERGSYSGGSFYWNVGSTTYVGAHTAAPNTKLNYSIKYLNGNFKVTGDIITSGTYSGQLGSTNLFFFQTQSCKLYSLKLYSGENLELVRNFIPCYRKSDAVIGLYDTISSTFFTNSGTGVFLKGENVYRGVDFATVEDITATKQELQTQIDDKVSLTKNEVINGQKIFTERPQIGEVRLPSEFTEVEYIKSTGNQYININLIPTSATKVEIKYLASDYSGQQAVIGCKWDGNAMLLNIQSSKWHFHGGVGIGSVAPSLTTPDNISYSTLASSFVVNGITYNNPTDTLANATTPFKVFGLGESSYNSRGSLYSLKIYNQDILVRDLIPCYTNKQVTNNSVTYEANTIGLYDLVNNIFYVNQGTGTFIKGQNALTGEYVALQSELPTANPTTTTETPDLTSIKINGTDYKIAGGSGGASANYNYYWGEE